MATIKHVFEQDNSYLFDITYDESKENALKCIDFITMLLKKNSTDRVRRKNTRMINRYTSENFQLKKM